MIPKNVKKWDVFASGRAYIGSCKSISLPNFQVGTENVQLSGTPYAMKAQTGEREPLDLSLVFTERDAHLCSRVFYPGGETSLEIVGYVSDGRGRGENLKISAKGLVTGMDMGTLRAPENDDEPLSVEMSLQFFAATQGGTEICYIDIPNMIERWQGSDKMAATRAALLRF